MRKLLFVLAICFTISLTITACKSDKKEAVETEAVETAKDGEIKDVASNVLYQCPMDCEKGKSYTKEGTCPVCKMKLKAKEVDMDAVKDKVKAATEAPLK